MSIMRSKRSEKIRSTRLYKNTVKALVLSFAAASIVMAMPVTGEAIVAVQATPQVEQHMEAYLAAELGGNLVVGDSITIDLDDIFVNAEELFYTAVTYNSSVAGVTLLSGDLHGNLQIKAMQTGTTMVQLIARTTEFGTPVYEQFRLSVASIPDMGDEGIDIADIVSYMYTNPGRLTNSDGVMQLLQNIKRVSPPVNVGPTTSGGSYEVNLAVDGQVVLDMDDFFSDPDDELNYNLLLPTENVISGVDLDGDQLTIDGSTDAIVLTVEAEDGVAGHAKVSKDFNITILNTAPVGTSDSYTIEEDGILSTGNVLDNDTDADGDPLIVMKEGDPSNGKLELRSDGTITYTPYDNFYGTDSFSYKLYDGTTYSEAVNVVISVTAVNDPVVVSNLIDAQTADKDTPFTFVVPEDTFSDVETATLFYQAATLSDGSELPSWLSFNGPSRTFTGTPLNEDVGVIAVRVTVTDGQYSVYSDFDITVNAVNDAPRALHEWIEVTLYNQQEIEFDMSQYFTDDEGSPLEYTYQINGTLEDHQSISYNSDSLILTVGNSGAFSSDSTLNISLSADDSTDNHGPALSTIHVNYKALNAPPGYLYVDSQHTYDLASFYTFPDYKNNEPINITFTPQAESETLIPGVSIDSQGILTIADAINGDYRRVVIKASDNHGATILSSIKVIVDKEIRIKETAPTTFYGGRDGDVYFEIYLPDIFETEGAKFDTYYLNGEPYTGQNLYFTEEYEDLPMTKTIQALDFYGNIVSYDIILDYNNQPRISYNNYGTDAPAIAIGLEIGAGSASLFDASHYAYDDDGDLLSYALATTDAVHTGAITDPIQKGGEFLLQGTEKGKLVYELTVTDPLGSGSNAYMPVEIYVVDKVVKLNTGEDSHSIALAQLATALGLVNPTYDIPSISNSEVVGSATLDGSTLTLLDASIYGGTTLITIPTQHEDGITNILIFVEVDLNNAPGADDDWYPELTINRGNALKFDLRTLFEDPEEDHIEEFRIVDAPDEANLSLSLEGDLLYIRSLVTENNSSEYEYYYIGVEARDTYGDWSTFPLQIYIGVVANEAISQTITLQIEEVDNSIYLPDYLGNDYFDDVWNLFDVVSDNTDVVVANMNISGNTVSLEAVGVGTTNITLIGDTGHGVWIYHQLLVEVIDVQGEGE
jgi:hypothetical protein